MKHIHHSSWKGSAASILFAILAPMTLCRGAEWHIKEAPIRFKLDRGMSPTHKSAGYFVLLPDGGLLPTPFPLPQVVTESGKPLASYILWHNRSSGFGMAFESDGSSGDVYVYVSPVNKLKLWTPQSGLTPSTIVCTQPGSGSMEAARTLGRMGSVGPNVHYRNQPANPQCALGLQGDQSGRPPPSSFYMLAYVVVDDPGSTWIAPFFHRGNSEVRVDDSTISPQKKIDKWGGTGQALDLTKGLHKVEIFSACDASADYSAGQGLVWFTWKPPHATVAELGGVRPTNVTFAGTSKQESRVLRTGEVVKSGDARIQEINLRDGGPVAYFTAEPKDVFWFGNDTPTIVYEFSALTTGYPTNTTYTWGFGDNAKPTGPKVVRFMTGQEEHPITLAATWSNKESRCTIPIFAYSTVKSSLDDASTRENFRMACLNMIKTYPPDTDPTVAWDKSMWDTFYAVQELGKGGQLLAEVLVNRWKHFKAKIPPEKEALLEDIFFHSISYMAPDKAIAWLEEQERTARSPERRNDLKIMLAEVYMYHKKNLQEAKKILMPLAAQGTTEVAAMASIRLGDVAFLEKNVSEANRYWGSAQNRVKLANDVLKDDEDSVKWKGDAAPEPEKAKAEPEKGKRGKEKDEPKKPLRPFMPHRDRVADWKKSAVLDTSMAAGVITLMKQGSYTDAFHELQKWERNFPTSKMSSDYILQEARFYMAIGNRQRARTSLEAYCENVDASSYLADAAELLFQCMLYDKEPDDVLTKFCEKMKKRFEFHPFAERVNSMLRQMRAGGVKMDATPDKIPNGI